MATVSLTNPNVEYQIVTLFEKLDAMRHESPPQLPHRLSMQAEVRTLEFWRSIISECLATFFYVFVVCGTYVHPQPQWAILHIYMAAFASGFAAATLTQCFGHISGEYKVIILEYFFLYSVKFRLSKSLPSKIISTE